MYDVEVEGEELLPVQEVGVDCTACLLGVKGAHLLRDRITRSKPAQRQLPWPRQPTLRAVEAPSMRLGEDLFHTVEDGAKLRFFTADVVALPRYGEGRLDLPLAEASKVVGDAGPPEPWHYGGPMTVEAPLRPSRPPWHPRPPPSRHRRATGRTRPRLHRDRSPYPHQHLQSGLYYRRRERRSTVWRPARKRTSGACTPPREPGAASSCAR